MKYLLDTHAWIWWHLCPAKLSRKVSRVIAEERGNHELLLSAISVWEFCKLLEKGRIGISCDPEEWLERALATPRLRLVPLSPSISFHSTVLPQPFTSDPADQIIAATAREENATILSKDAVLSRYKHVRTMW